jgi:Spy/CpxP family protein refolding chaperone
VSNGQRRIRATWDEFNPRMKSHYCETRDQINEILTPEQRERFEALMERHRPVDSEDGKDRDRDGRRDGSRDDKD